MVQLELDPGLYETIRLRAHQSSLSITDWLRAVADQEADRAEYQVWFAHLIAHDLRTPLAAILTSTDILKLYSDRLTDERRTEHLDTIQMQVRALNHLLDNVVVLQKHANNLLVYDPAPQDLRKLCEAAVQTTIQTVYGQPQIILHAPDMLAPVSFDEKLLRIALVNLLLNAIKFSADNQPIYLTLDNHHDRVMIAVIDSGIGIPPDEQPLVFDLFFRASNARSQSGHGLGLTVVQRIVSLHGGDIQIRSAPGQGTTFTILLPVISAVLQQAAEI